MELRQLKYFVAVAEDGQFVSASRRMFVSQPALSQQIKLLENELGVELFVKIQRQVYRKVVLTEAGQVLLKDAKKILQLCDKAKENAKNAVTQRRTLNLGTYRMLVGRRIMDTLALFAEHLSGWDIKMVELPTHLSVQEAVLDETIDVGISVLPLKNDKLEAIVLKKSRLTVILPQHHPLAALDKLTLSTLRHEKWIEIDAAVHPIFEEIERLCLQAGFNRRPNIVQEVSSLEVMAQLVALGRGIAFVPSFFETSTVVGIVNRPLDDASIEFEQCLVFRKDKWREIKDVLNNAI